MQGGGSAEEEGEPSHRGQASEEVPCSLQIHCENTSQLVPSDDIDFYSGLVLRMAKSLKFQEATTTSLIRSIQ